MRETTVNNGKDITNNILGERSVDGVAAQFGLRAIYVLQSAIILNEIWARTLLTTLTTVLTI
jgi:hypothetical protein